MNTPIRIGIADSGGDSGAFASGFRLVIEIN